MKFAHTGPKGAAWGSLLLAILCTLVALPSTNIELILIALFFGGLSIISFFSSSRAKQQQEEFEKMLQHRTKAECRQFLESEEEIRKKLAAGKLRYLVEWWEEDSPFINENAHMEFFFTDGSSVDVVLHRPTVEKLHTLLASHGIEWEWRLQLHFDSNILYPPPYAGQKFYTPEGKPRKDVQF